MISYRKSLEQIGIPSTQRVAYSDFYCRPKSLSKAMEAMQPAGAFNQVSDNPLDADWTDEINGCATDGAYWFFTSNQTGDGKRGGVNKCLQAFKIGSGVSIGPWHDTFTFASDDHESDIPADVLAEIGGIDHIGQLQVFNGKIYVSHFNGKGSHVFILRNDDGKVSYDDKLDIGRPAPPRRQDKVQFQCIVPWDRTFLTCYGDGDIDELFVHDLDDGTWMNDRSIRLQTAISAAHWVQGAAFSDYGHLFISASTSKEAKYGWLEAISSLFELGRGFLKMAAGISTGILEIAKGVIAGVFDIARSIVSGAKEMIHDLDLPYENKVDTQLVHIVSPLNGRELGVISVLAEGSWAVNLQELEGCCYRPIPMPDGSSLEFHIVLLDKRLPALDNMFFKSYERRQPTT